jgi:hypothetical protein
MKFIINPLTNEKTLLKSPEGKKILLKYVKSFQEGGSAFKKSRRQRTQQKRRSDRIAGLNYCPEGMIVTYNIQGTYIEGGLFDGTLEYIQTTPSIFCVQEIGGLSNVMAGVIKRLKGGHNFRQGTIRQAQFSATDIQGTQENNKFFGNIDYISKFQDPGTHGAIIRQGHWECIQYYWNGPNKGPKDTAILYNTKSYTFKNTLSIPFEGAGKQFRPIGGVLLDSKNLGRKIAVFTIHMPSLGGGVIPHIYESIRTYLNDEEYLGIDIFLVGDFNLDSDTVKTKSRKRKRTQANETLRKRMLDNLLDKTGSILYESSNATHQSGRKLDYIIHRPARGYGLPIKQAALDTLLSHNVAGSDHSSLGLCLKDIFPEVDGEASFEEGDGEEVDEEVDGEVDEEVDGEEVDGEVSFEEGNYD